MAHLLEVKDLSMYYKIKSGFIKAVDDVSLSIDKGQSLGIVGESGCGKTSLILTVLRLIPDNGEVMGGKIIFDNKDILKLSDEEYRKTYRWKKISIIFQNSMNALNPVIKIKNQIINTIKLHMDVSDDEAEKKMSEIIELVGLHYSVLNNYPHELSGGMKQRVIIALSLICNPDLLIADEPTTALDVVVQDQIIEHMKQLQEKLNITLIIVSHNISTIFETCERMIVMYGGKIVEYADAVSIYNNPRHPYTAALLKAFPSIRGDLKELVAIPGTPVSLENPPDGCRFEQRCKFAKPICSKENPPLIEIVPNEHYSLCHFAEKGKMEW